MKKISKMQKVSINELIATYEADSKERPENAKTNALMIAMLENASIEFLTVELNQNSTIYNRGSVGECLGSACVNEYVTGRVAKHYAKKMQGVDFTTYNKNAKRLQELGLDPSKTYDFKVISGKSRASYSNKEKADFYIIIDIRLKTKGVYLVSFENLIFYNDTSIKDYKQGKRLDLLGELLGL